MTIVFDADCKWLQEDADREMQSALARFPDIDLVYAHNDPQAFGAYCAAQRAGRKGIRFIGIDALPDEGLRYVRDGILDATFEYPTCGSEAIDLGLLVVNRVDLPKQIVLGSRVFSRENIATGGDPLPAPGAVLLASLRARHEQLLQPDSAHPGLWVIAMSQCNGSEPWRRQMNEDLRRAAARYPQVQLKLNDAMNNADTQRTQIDEFVSQKVHCLLVSPKETQPLTPPVARAFQAGIPVIVIDRQVAGEQYTCFVGADNYLVGKAAGRHVHRLLGGKGRLVELKGLMTSKPAEDRHTGFADGLREAERDRPR